MSWSCCTLLESSDRKHTCCATRWLKSLDVDEVAYLSVAATALLRRCYLSTAVWIVIGRDCLGAPSRRLTLKRPPWIDLLDVLKRECVPQTKIHDFCQHHVIANYMYAKQEHPVPRTDRDHGFWPKFVASSYRPWHNNAKFYEIIISP